MYLLPVHILKICSYKVVKRIYHSIVVRFHIIGVQVTIGRLGKYLGTKSRQQQLAESGLLEKKNVHNVRETAKFISKVFIFIPW